MSAEPNSRVAVIGAGLAGALMACYLGRAGYQVTVYERRDDPRVHGFAGGRSINLALSERGIHALREVGLADAVLKAAIPMPGRMIHLTHPPHLTFIPYSKNPDDRINSVSRADLNLILLNAAAAYPNVKLVFDHRCAAIDFKSGTITFQREESQEPVIVKADRIIGADGAFSAVRLQMMLNMDRFEYDQSYLEHGYKELTIPSAHSGMMRGESSAVGALTPTLSRRERELSGFAMNPNALHIWPRGGYMMIALPNQDRSFTCTCFWPFSGANGFDSLRSDDEIRRFFTEHFPDAVPLMSTLVEDFKRNPTGSLVTVKCWPWHLGGKAVLIGDAAHAIVPFYGQGMNAAFEDCSVLNKCLGECGGDWERAFENFDQQRKPHADAIAEMALENFVEMRDKTASRAFHAWKKLEKVVHRMFPRWYMPLYNMISFSTIPYAEAKRRAAHQARVLKWGGLIGISVMMLMLIGLVIWLAN